MTRYAASTDVSTERSRNEIESTLRRYGATSFGYAWQGTHQMITFEARARRIRFILPMPDRKDRKFTQHSRGWRTEDAAEKAWEQACRQSWRALALVIKAKLEAVAAGITEFEDEFLAHTVLPDNSTVAQWVKPQIAVAYERGEMPPMLPDYSQRSVGEGGA